MEHLQFILITICFVIGIARKIRLDNLGKLKFGHVHGSGSQTLLGFISLGVFITVISIILRQLYESRYTKGVKVKVSMFVGIVSGCVLFIIAFLIR